MTSTSEEVHEYSITYYCGLWIIEWYEGTLLLSILLLFLFYEVICANSFCSLIFAILLSVLRCPSILMMKTSCRIFVGFVDRIAVFSWIRESPKKLKVIPSVRNSRVTSSGMFLSSRVDFVASLVETISKVSPWSKAFSATTVSASSSLTVCLATELAVMYF